MKEYQLRIFYSKLALNGYSVKTLSKTMGLNPGTLYVKIRKKRPFTSFELSKIKKLLHLSMEDIETIFFE